MSSSSEDSLMSKAFFMAIIWAIWKERNALCFEGTASHCAILAEKVKIYMVTILPQFQGISVSDIIRNWKEVSFSYSFRNPVMVSLSPPAEGLCKLNFDGSAFGNPRFTDIGGVIQNSAYDILLSFSGRYSVNEAGLLALRTGI